MIFSSNILEQFMLAKMYKSDDFDIRYSFNLESLL